MIMQTQYDEKKHVLTIQIEGRFDFSCHKAFKDAYSSVESNCKFELDMTKVTYVDSSALGMLLLLRDYAGGDQGEIVLNNCNDAVEKILRIANFDRLFSLH